MEAALPVGTGGFIAAATMVRAGRMSACQARCKARFTFWRSIVPTQCSASRRDRSASFIERRMAARLGLNSRGGLARFAPSPGRMPDKTQEIVSELVARGYDHHQ